jgi:hypothetical protein
MTKERLSDVQVVVLWKELRDIIGIGDLMRVVGRQETVYKYMRISELYSICGSGRMIMSSVIGDTWAIERFREKLGR